MKAIVIIFPTKLVTSSLLFLCFHLVKTEYYANLCNLVVLLWRMIQFLLLLLLSLLFMASQNLLQRQPKLNRFLEWRFFTCYFCLHYSFTVSILKHKNWKKCKTFFKDRGLLRTYLREIRLGEWNDKICLDVISFPVTVKNSK